MNDKAEIDKQYKRGKNVAVLCNILLIPLHIMVSIMILLIGIDGSNVVLSILLVIVLYLILPFLAILFVVYLRYDDVNIIKGFAKTYMIILIIVVSIAIGLRMPLW